MRLRHLVISALALGPVAAVAGPAHADPAGPTALPVQVVAIHSDDAEDQAEALTSALRSAVRRARGWSLPGGDFSLEVIALALKCGDVPDEACQARIGEHIKAERYIWGTLRRSKKKQVAVDLHLYRRGEPATVAEYTYNDNLTEPGDDALKKVASDALEKLTGGPPKGDVRIKTSLTNGDLFIDGEPSGSVRNGEQSMQLPVGEHSIEVRGVFTKEVGLVTVHPSSSVELVLAPPGAARHEEATDEASASSKPPGGRWQKTAGYVSLGVGGAFVLGGLYSMLKVNALNHDDKVDDYRKGFTRDHDICEEAAIGNMSTVPGAARPPEMQDICKQGTTFKTLQYVFYGAGALALGAGTYLLLTADEGTSPADTAASGRGRVRVAPAVGPGLAAVDVNVTF